MEIEIRVQETPLDVAEELAPMYTGNAAVGGVVSFVGLMRDLNEGDQVEFSVTQGPKGYQAQEVVKVEA